MNAAFLSQPAAGVHVRFFGQTFCSSGSASETSCQQPGGGFCAPGTLCGSAFQIGTDQVTAPIPGYQNGSGSPNWALVTVPFDTTNYANDYLVFWVVTWMEDRNGNKVTEMPDHGLLSTFSKGANYSQIIQVPVEQHSNNVGMYPLQSPFHVAPKGSQIDPNDSTPSSQLGSSPNALRSVEVFPLLGGAGNGNLQALTEYVTLLKTQGSIVPERTLNKLLGEVDAILTCQGR